MCADQRFIHLFSGPCSSQLLPACILCWGMAPAGSEGKVSAAATSLFESAIWRNSLFKPVRKGCSEPVCAMAFTPCKPTLLPHTWVPVAYTTTLSKIDEHITRKLNHLISTCSAANTWNDMGAWHFTIPVHSSECRTVTNLCHDKYDPPLTALSKTIEATLHNDQHRMVCTSHKQEHCLYMECCVSMECHV